MNDEKINADEIDLYHLLEDLMNKKKIILITMLMCFLSAAAFYELTKGPDKYLTTSSVLVRPLVEEKREEFGHRFILQPSTLLSEIEYGITDTSNLYLAFESLLKTNNVAIDWIDSENRIAKPISIRNFHEHFPTRLMTARKGNELKVTFFSDTPDGGEATLDFFLNLAISYGYERAANSFVRKSDYLETFTQFLDLNEELDPIKKSEINLFLKNALNAVELHNILSLKEMLLQTPAVATGKKYKSGLSQWKLLSSSLFLGFVLGIMLALLVSGYQRNAPENN